MKSINLNINLCSILRDTINQHQNYSIHKTHSIKKDKNGNSWLKICAIMDRLDDTSVYLNTIDFDIPKDRTSIFQFYNFMNNAATLLDCIAFLSEIFDFDMSEYDKKSNIFNKSKSPNSGTDKRYFEYLRSLCSVHPIKTNHQHEFKDTCTYAESSPYVSWNYDNSDMSDGELIAVVYIDNPEHSSKYIYIKLDEIFTYVKFRFNILEKIIKHIDYYFQEIINNYTQIPINKENDFSDYCEYINYLKKVYSERIDTGWNEVFDFYILVMNCSYENEENQRKLTKYKNIIKYAFSSLHNYLQTLPIKGASENIKDNNNNYEMQKDNYLFCELQSCEAGKYRFNHMYAFEKLSFLYLNKRYMDMAQILVNEIKDYWEPYVQFDSYMSADEICILLHIASYFWRLDNDSDFEKNIPNTNDYR